MQVTYSIFYHPSRQGPLITFLQWLILNASPFDLPLCHQCPDGNIPTSRLPEAGVARSLSLQSLEVESSVFLYHRNCVVACVRA